MTENELYHHGILGMKWGVRRFQPYSSTGPRKGGATGKEIGEAARKPTRAERKAEKKLAKKREKNLAKARKAKEAKQKEEEANEKIKNAIAKSGSAKLIEKNANMFTTAELRDLKDRINLKAELRDISNRETNKKVDRFISYLKSSDSFMNTSISLYNSIAATSNSYLQNHGKLTRDNYMGPISKDIKKPVTRATDKGAANYRSYLKNPNAATKYFTDDEIRDLSKRAVAISLIEKNLSQKNNKTP